MHIFWLGIFIYFYRIWKRREYQTKLLAVCLGWLALTTTPWLPNLLVYHLEMRYDILKLDKIDSTLTHILVLGGGHHIGDNATATEKLMKSSLARLVEGVRIYNSLPNATLISSGYASRAHQSMALSSKNAAIALGISSHDILMQETPHTTEEEAQVYNTSFSHLKARLILVTSDTHMPRAMYLFRQQGLNPIPAPADQTIKWEISPTTFWDIVSQKTWSSDVANQQKFTTALHEYLGLVWARIN